jgi:NAD(P)-dependent dehydrogenase (short-subunit alcohol dehydrogenase family)
MVTAVVIGGNRGIGLGFTEEYLKAGYDVVTTYRDESTLGAETTLAEDCKESLEHLKQVYKQKLTLYKLEITDEKSVAKFAETIAKVDLLILSAGIKGYPVPGTRPPDHTSQHLRNAFQVNTEAHDTIVRYFYPLLSQTADACVVYMSSLVGQTADNGGGGYHPYRASKAASNALIWNWSIELMLDWKKRNPQNLTKTPCAFPICPGWVRTDMGGQEARLSVTESVSAMIKVIDNVRETKKSNGLYMYDGEVAEKYDVRDVSIIKEVLFAKEEEKVKV